MTDHRHDDDTVIEAIKHQLDKDYRLYKEDLDVEVRRHSDEGEGDYIHAFVNIQGTVNLYRNTVPSYIQNFRIGSGRYDISVVASPEELELEG